MPQENLALVCDRSDGMPLFCRLVPGSVPDVVTLDATARILRALGLKDIEFALDRGFYSNSNARELLLKGHHFTLGVLLSCKQSTDLVARHRAALNSPKRSIFHEGRSVAGGRVLLAFLALVLRAENENRMRRADMPAAACGVTTNGTRLLVVCPPAQLHRTGQGHSRTQLDEAGVS